MTSHPKWVTTRTWTRATNHRAKSQTILGTMLVGSHAAPSPMAAVVQTVLVDPVVKTVLVDPILVDR